MTGWKPGAPKYGDPNDYEQNLEAFNYEYQLGYDPPMKVPQSMPGWGKPPSPTPADLFHLFNTKADIMNLSTAIFLVNDDVRAIRCAYEVDSEGKPTKLYTYKTLDPNTKVGDVVVVPTDTRIGFTCVKVFEVDVEPDLEGNIQLKWIVSTADIAGYERLLQQEADMQATIAKAEKRAKKEVLREKLLKDNPELAGIALAKDAPMLSPPPAAEPHFPRTGNAVFGVRELGDDIPF